MKKLLSIMIVLAMVMALVLNVIAWGPVSELTDEELEVVYSDHFGDDHKESDWIYGGGVKVADGVMSLNAPITNDWIGNGFAAMLKGSAVDYSRPHVIEFRAAVAEGGSLYAGFGIRAGSGNSIPNLNNGGRWGTGGSETATGIAVDLRVAAAAGVTGLSFENGEAQSSSAQYIINNPSALSDVFAWNSYKIADDGDKITVWVNGSLFFTIEMSGLVDGWYQTVVVKDSTGTVVNKSAGDRNAVVAETGNFGFFQRAHGIAVDDVVVKVEKLPDYEMVNAAFDELLYDGTALVSQKAYTWVHDEANRPAMDFEKGTVSNITFRGWARTTMTVAGFGYRIDGGDLVTGDFIQDRAAELEAAGETGAQGYLVTVPADQLMTGEHTIAIYVIDEYDRDIEIVKTKNGVDYPIEITFTVSPSTVVPTEPVNSNHNIDKNKCNADMTEYNVYGWSVYNMPVKALGYKLDGGEPVWIVTEISEEPRENDTGRAANDIFRDAALDPVLASNGLTGGLDPFWAYRINVTLDITGFEVGDEHTVEVVVKFTDEAETVQNAFRTQTFTFTRKVPNKITLIKDGESSKINTGAMNNVAASMNGDVIVFTTTKADDTWFEIPLPEVDSSVYTKIEFKYRASSVWGNNAYLKDTEFNKGYSPVAGTWAPPALTGDDEWHTATYVIATMFPSMAGKILTGLRIPAGAAVGDTFEVEYVALRTAEDPVPPAELSVTMKSIDEAYVNDGGKTGGSADAWLAENPISVEEGETLKLGAKGWVFVNGAAALTGVYYVIDDGEYVGGAQYLQSRPDVINALAGVGGTEANTTGFNVPRYEIDVSECAAGEHSVKLYVLAEDANGNTTYCRFLKISFTITPKPVVVGDINGDGFINNKDVVVLFRAVSESLTESDVYIEANSDVNGDGFINNKDVVALFKSVSED